MPSNKAKSQTDKRLKANRVAAGKPEGKTRAVNIRMRINQRYVDLVEGKIKVTDLDDKEIERGQIRGPNGKFGSRPDYIPSKFHTAMVNELKKRMEAKFAKDVEPMRKVLKEIANNQRTSPDARYKSAVYLIDRGVGKVAEKQEHLVDVRKWEDGIADLLVDYTEEASNDDDKSSGK